MGLIFADVLTQLLEDIAGVIEHYYGIIENSYSLKWTPVLIEKLQVTMFYIVRMRLIMYSIGGV